MSLPSRFGKRASMLGFTLLEAMLAFGILSIVLAAVYSLSANVLFRQIEARREYDLASMARALLDEYVLTYPQMAQSGNYKNSWTWTISETPQEVLQETSMDHYFSFIKITAKVKRVGDLRNIDFALSTVVARRAKTK